MDEHFNATSLIRPASGYSSMRVVMFFLVSMVPVYFWLCWEKDIFANPVFASAFFGMVASVIVGKAWQNQSEILPDDSAGSDFKAKSSVPDALKGESLVGSGRSTQFELSDIPATYPDTFRPVMVFVLNHETEWSRDGSVRVERDARDPGGTTKFGIDAASHHGTDIAALTLEGALDIYLDEWVRFGCAALAPLTAFAYFDAAVNCGFGHARSWLATPNTASDHEHAVAICDRRAHYYQQEVRETLRRVYLSGWMARLRDLRKALETA